MTSRRSALRTWVAPPTFISDNPRLRRSSTIENRHNANTPWPPGRRHLAGHRSRSSLSTKTSGLSGSGIVERNGFARLTAEVALGHVGIVLGLEVSRLARNNADWYR